jgi:hypothetical protein
MAMVIGVFMARCLDHILEWWKSHATHIKISAVSCDSTQFDWLNAHTISLWLYNSPRRSRHVVTRSRQSLVFQQTSARMSLPVQRVFTVELYLSSRPYLTCPNEFRGTFPNSPVPNKSAVFRLVNRFRYARSMKDRNRSGRPSLPGD